MVVLHCVFTDWICVMSLKFGPQVNEYIYQLYYEWFSGNQNTHLVIKKRKEKKTTCQNLITYCSLITDSFCFICFSGHKGKQKSAISHLHERKSGSFTHLAGVVVQRVIVDGAVFPVLDLEEAGTLRGASILGCLGGRSLALRWWLQVWGNHFILCKFSPFNTTWIRPGAEQDLTSGSKSVPSEQVWSCFNMPASKKSPGNNRKSCSICH